jgi:hypothetical protein
MQIGDLIVFKESKYFKDPFVVMRGFKNQNGINYSVSSFDARMMMTILERESKKVGQIDGDSFYEIKSKWGHTISAYATSMVYLSEITFSD